MQTDVDIIKNESIKGAAYMAFESMMKLNDKANLL